MEIGINIGMPQAGGGLDIATRLKTFGTLTFYKDYANRQASANADYSIGSPTVAVTAARSGSAPATYFTLAGLIQTLTTANVPRWTQGYYDQTGFHIKPGLMVESGGALATGRNNIIQSEVFTDVAWVATTITVTSAVVDNVLNPTVSVLSATGASSKIIQAVVDAVAGKYTASIFIKRKTGTGTISLRANTADTATDITAFVGSGWTRVQVTSSSAVNPTFELDIETSGDEVYVFGAQLEKFPWATSYIPTTTASRTRAAETVKYAIASNRTVATETLFVKFTPIGSSFVNDGLVRTFLDADTKQRPFAKASNSGNSSMKPNATDNSTVSAVSTTTPVAGTSFVIAANMRTTTVNADTYPYVRIYGNGIKEASYTTGAYTDNAWGTNFEVGSAAAGNNQINGIIEAVAIYSTWIDDPAVNSISFILSPGTVTPHSYALTVTAPTSATNVVSGTAGSTGNVRTNVGYLRKDNYVCGDAVFVNSNRTAEISILFQLNGSDASYVAGSAAPIGDIIATIYTKSTNTLDTVQKTIWTDATYTADELYARRNDGEAFYRLYFTVSLRSDGAGHGKGIYMIKSSSLDIATATWSAPVFVMQSSDVGGYVPGDCTAWIATATPGQFAMPILSNNSSAGHLYYTTDNGDTFTQGPAISSDIGGVQEGWILDSPTNDGRLLAIYRVSTQGALQYSTSSDWGATWTAKADVTMGVMGTGVGVKVKPRIYRAAGNVNNIVGEFYDRNLSRLLFIGPTSFNNAYNNIWPNAYLLGGAFNSNGGMMIIDELLNRYIVSTAGGVDPNNTTNWWIIKDLYTWVAQ